MRITLIGLGNCPDDLTKKAELALSAASRIIARTDGTESFKSLSGYNVETLDGVFV